jgi:hypothetical protein
MTETRQAELPRPSSSSSKESDLVGVSSPRSFVTRWIALWAFSFYFRACIALLWVWFTARLVASSGKLASCGMLWAPQSPYARLQM